MSTYLVAIAITDYACLDAIYDTTMSKNVTCSICARPNAIGALNLAYNASLEVLPFFENYYEVAYQLPKLGEYLNMN
jgi:aminopeptidase N